ncbi:DUF2637 domain-containing protein [Streptomyces tubercidicus]|uniref:DUF2637 domain-containing protein n=1 Tax=Streptomyces tubercidicus TaxID=47759 RepID=A0A640US73_9ACTN|nr:DUF2637 domain-containing protein [Streptomyces tubercidicus]WAU13368.1 DUF2637 domain-containing protein [Streptomyces tubercidicus]GFE38958.1 hypothetical protein Stube_36310 [Streptomyces tubercidicus]
MSATQTAQLTRTHRILIGVVIAGAALIAAIGFTGSYTAVRELAEKKGFGAFSAVFPIGIDAGIVVLLALDLLLTWIRIPFPLLRQTAWLLTAATIAFNGAAAWPDALGVGMHAVIPLLFVVAVEAARHAIGRIADITADKHMEGVRLTRWLLAFPSTFRLWRRMKLWELRSYDQVIQLEQDRLVYQARLRARYGRAWRRRAPVDALMPLRLARYGVPLARTGAAGLAAAGIELPAATDPAAGPVAPAPPRTADAPPGIAAPVREDAYGSTEPVGDVPAEPVGGSPAEPVRAASPAPPYETPPTGPEPHPAAAPAPEPAPDPAPAPQLTVPVGPGRSRPLGNAGEPLPVPDQRAPAPEPESYPEPDPEPEPEPQLPPAPEQLPPVSALPDDVPRDEAYYTAYRMYVAEKNDFPDSRQFGRYLLNSYGVTGRDGGPLSDGYLRGFVREFQHRFRSEMGNEYIP